FLWIREEPLDATAGCARKRGRGPICPVKIEKGHSRCIQLRAALDESLARAVRAYDSLTGHGERFASRRFTHRLHAPFNGSEEVSQTQLPVCLARLTPPF